MCFLVVSDQRGFLNVPFASVVLLSLVATDSFFATGHQATIAGIRWEAAFHGFSGDHATVWIPALLVVFNTFGTQILGTLAVPLLLLWPFTCGRHSAGKASTTGDEKAAEESDGKGEFVLNEDNGMELKRGLFELTVKFLLLAAMKVYQTFLQASFFD
jgi:GPI ethanolamine phosphate transferase 3 subunit O